MHRPPSGIAETKLPSERPLRRSEGIECQQLGDELMALDSQADRVHVLNGTMAAIWELCDGRRSAEEIAQALSASFDCSEFPELLAKTRDALQELAALGLVVAPDGDEREDC